MISAQSRGSFKNTKDFLARMKRGDHFKSLDKHGAAGVAALAAATPRDAGIAARSWSYKIKREKGRIVIEWYNANREGGPPVVILAQYGHATRNGGFVEGRDFINPAIRPIFDQIAEDVWKEVTR